MRDDDKKFMTFAYQRLDFFVQSLFILVGQIQSPVCYLSKECVDIRKCNILIVLFYHRLISACVRQLCER